MDKLPNGDYGHRMATSGTPTQRLASVLLGQPVQQWLRQQRTTGRSWRLITRDLYETTNGQIDITHEAARKWANEPEKAAS